MHYWAFFRARACRFDDEGAGVLSNVIEAVEYASMMGAAVASNSYGGGPRSLAFANALNQASQMLFVAAAGNDGPRDNDLNPQYKFPHRTRKERDWR